MKLKTNRNDPKKPRNTSGITSQSFKSFNTDFLTPNVIVSKMVNVYSKKTSLDFVSKRISTRKGTSKAI